MRKKCWDKSNYYTIIILIITISIIHIILFVLTLTVISVHSERKKPDIRTASLQPNLPNFITADKYMWNMKCFCVYMFREIRVFVFWCVLGYHFLSVLKKSDEQRAQEKLTFETLWVEVVMRDLRLCSCRSRKVGEMEINPVGKEKKKNESQIQYRNKSFVRRINSTMKK